MRRFPLAVRKKDVCRPPARPSRVGEEEVAGKMQNCASRTSVVGGGGAQRVFRQSDHLHLLEPAVVKAEAEAAPKAELPLHLFMRRATVGIWWGGGI